jgi:hypothetical protein
MGLLQDIDRSFKRLYESVDKISDKEAEMDFDDLDDKDVDNDGDSDKSDKYLHNKLGNVAKRVDETAYKEVKAKYAGRPVVIHYIGNDMTKWLVTFTKTNKTVPYADVVANLTDMSGKPIGFPSGFRSMYEADEEELEEMSTTAGVPGYQTPFAFGDADEDTYGQGGMKKVKKTNRIFKPMESKSTFKKMMSEMYGVKSSTNEAVSYRDYKKDPTSTPQQKVNKGIAEVNAMLSEMEKIVANNLRLKTEMGVQSNHFWKSTGARFAKINERMTRIANKLKELSQ